MTPELTVDEFRELLSSALPSAQDADTAAPSPTTLFTPDSHRAALHLDTTVVRGGRGAGKTFWYHSLLDPRLRTVAAEEYRIDRLRAVEVRQGHGAGYLPQLYPSPGALGALVEKAARPKDIWETVLLTALGAQELIRADLDWHERVQWTREHPEERDRAILAADRRAAELGTTVLVLFDALEHLHRDRVVADRLVSGILQLALEMRLRTKGIRFKVFVRPDMFDGAPLNFADASKLKSNAASLQWSRANLYGLLFHHLGNQSNHSSARFREGTGAWDERIEGRHVAPSTLRGDEAAQAKIFDTIAGPYMGASYRKGLTYTWLPNHLMDGVENVSPRIFLTSLRNAVDETQNSYAGHEYPLHHEGIRRGVQAASEVRVAELEEDTPWVKAAVSPLRGQQVPMESALVLALWEGARLADQLHRDSSRVAHLQIDENVRTGPRFIDDPERLIDELVSLGVMRRRRDGRIDLPDVYRIAFSIGRKGGVPMAKN